MGRELLRLNEQSSRIDFGEIIYCVAFSPDSKRIITGGEDKDHVAYIWDAVTGKQLLRLKGHTAPIVSAAFSSDGKRIVTGSGGKDLTARVWDAAIGKVLLQLNGGMGAVAFSPDGKRVVTASGDNTVHLWDAVTGMEVLRLGNAASSAAFSPDGTELLTGHEDGIARVWRKMSAVQVVNVKQQQKETQAMTRLATMPLEAVLQEANRLAITMPGLRAKIAALLNAASWRVVDPTKPRPTSQNATLALYIAEKAVELTHAKDGAILDTLAAARFMCGDLDGALAAQRQAVQYLPDNNELKARLIRYEKLKTENQRGQR